MAELRDQAPHAGRFADDLFAALCSKKVVIRDQDVASCSLCMPLAKKPAQAGKLDGWLRQFVKEGLLTQSQAATFWLRAKELAKSPDEHASFTAC